MTVQRLFVMALLLTLPRSAVGQWTFLSGDIWGPEDMAVIDGAVVVTCDGASCEAPAYISTDEGDTWTPFSSASVREARAVEALPDGFFLEFSNQEAVYGTPDAATWTSTTPASGNVTSLFYDKVGDVLYATTQSLNLRISRDRGATWEDGGVLSKDDELSWVHARGNRIFAGYNQSSAVSGAKTFLSLDGGDTWTELGFSDTSGGFVAPNGDLYLLQNVGGALTNTTTLFYSKDDGQTWTERYRAPRVGLQGRSTPLRARTQVYVEGTDILLVANDRVYVSHDGGDTWEDKSEGIIPDKTKSSYATRFLIDGDTAYLLLRSDLGDVRDGYGVYKRPVAELGLTGSTRVANESPALPKVFALHAAYPNPFNPQTTLSFTLDRPGPVRLAVYDVLGREVAVVTEGLHGVGTHRYAWDAGALASGRYLVRLETDVGARVRRVALAK